jgi:CubicO group peptidase (beta-lactamase class C family)
MEALRMNISSGLSIAAFLTAAMLSLTACDRGPYMLDPVDIPAEVRTAVDAAVLPLVNTYQSVGLVAGVICDGERYILGYGSTRILGRDVPDAQTLFEIGSVTKACTGLLLAVMAGEGTVDLDDPARAYLPEGATLPAFDGQEISLRHLAMHTSGLPRLPADLFTGAGFNRHNPYAHYNIGDMLRFVSGYTLPRAPGAVYEYSNLAAGLLGNLLADLDKKTYEEAFVARIAEPLAVEDTRITLSESQGGRLAWGHTSIAHLFQLSLPFPTANWDIPAFAGAGGLRSSVGDMLTLLEAAMGPAESPLHEAFELSMQPGFTINGRMRVGLGWHLITPDDDAEPLVWHNGATGGYTSFVGCLREAGVAVVLLNNSNTNVDRAALQILGALSGRDFLGR